MSGKVRILSIDGGGIKGIVSGIVLKHVEDQLQEKEGNDVRLSDYFDLIAGTSTGGILACLYITPDKNNRPKYTAEEALGIYLNRGGAIFNQSIFQLIKSVDGLTDEKYSADQLEKTLSDYFSKTKLGNLLKPCLITAYDIKNRRTKFFNSLDAQGSPDHNFFVKDIARATSAAPTYFEPAKISSFTDESFPLVDGAVFANNPALCAYSEARAIDFTNLANVSPKIKNPSAKDMFILSIGSTGNLKSYKYKTAKNWGKIEWIRPIIDILMSASEETVHYHLEQIFKVTQNEENYVRLGVSLDEASSDIDDASKQNIDSLIKAGKAYVKKNKQILATVVEKLIDNK